MRLFCLTVLLLATTSCFHYSSKRIQPFSLPQNPEFEVVRTSAFSKGVEHGDKPGLFLKVKLPDSTKLQFFKLQRLEKLSMLQHDSSDWITNLLLYEKYKEDAFLYDSIIKTRVDWLPIKAQDVRKWRRLLK